jgi:siderophore synthetase component
VTAAASRASALVSGEPALLARLLNTLLREDVYGLRSTASLRHEPDGPWLRIRLATGVGLIPVRPDGFLSDLSVREPVLVWQGRRLTSLADVLDQLARLAPVEDQPGHHDLAAECAQTLATWRLHERHHDRVLRALATAPRAGLAGSLRDETLAAFLDHPVYPLARGRFGLRDADLLGFAPEFAPSFPLRWLALPADLLTTVGVLPDHWPSMASVGLPRGLGDTHRLLPVHPLTVGQQLTFALREAGIEAGQSVLAPLPWLIARPTLSMRTLAVATDLRVHLKLPLPTSSLGVRNRRTIKPATLIDGAVAERLLTAVLARDRALAAQVLLADEQSYAHAGHELLALLVRRYPAELTDARVVPVAALLAPAPDGRLVIDEIADEFFDGDLPALLDAYLRPLFDVHLTLWLRYGIVLEAHQQNIALVLDRPAGRPRLRLLYKDNDGPRVLIDRLAAALPLAARAARFADQRIVAHTDDELADMFITITLHLCAGALVFGLADAGRLDAADGLWLVRDRLRQALAAQQDAPAAKLAAARLFRAPRLPIKTMLTVGTLLSKRRSGAADINKHYGADGPNYLLGPGGAGDG